MSDIVERINSSIRLGVIDGTPAERGVFERQAVEASNTIVDLRRQLAAANERAEKAEAECERLRSALAYINSFALEMRSAAMMLGAIDLCTREFGPSEAAEAAKEK